MNEQKWPSCSLLPDACSLILIAFAVLQIRSNFTEVPVLRHHCPDQLCTMDKLGWDNGGHLQSQRPRDELTAYKKNSGEYYWALEVQTQISLNFQRRFRTWLIGPNAFISKERQINVTQL